MEPCTICPRRCNIPRPIAAGQPGIMGLCKMPRQPMVARAALHNWEEPCISGIRGSGTVFFSGCSLRCCYCQNHNISMGEVGRFVSIERLRAIYRELIAQGAHNINLVTASHFVQAVAQSLEPRLPVPVAYNCGGYESLEALHLLEGKVQIYLPDLKYLQSHCAARYSAAPDYPEVAKAAILEMYRQVGDYVLDGNGILQRGVVIRHLVLPNHLENTFDVIDWVAGQFRPGQVLFSLMRQYIPCGEAARYPELNRPLTSEEYERAERYLLFCGIEDGFLQEEGAASVSFIPDFDLKGVEPTT